MDIESNKIFVIHYYKLKERKQNMINQLNQNYLKAEFVEQYDRNNLNINDIKIFSNKKDFGNMAITLSHLYCYKEISEKYKYGLILEDDSCFNNTFYENLNNYFNQLPNDWDMLFLDDGCNFHIPKFRIIPNKNIYRKSLLLTNKMGLNGSTRCTSCYLVSNKCASKITYNIQNYYYNNNLKINLAVDHWLNYINLRNNFNIYWGEPTISTQGTQNGKYKTSH